MNEFKAARAMDELKERSEQLAEGRRLVPILTAIIAVFAALATLSANHNSVSALVTKNEAILDTSKATDTWNYYQAKRLKLELNRSLLVSGAATSASGRAQMQKTVDRENRGSQDLLAKAQQLDAESDDQYERGERFMRAYEKFLISATLLEVSVVLISIAAASRTLLLVYVAGATAVVGLGFFAFGWIFR